jgi:hypothetical protein
LPDAALAAVFSFCSDAATIPTICLVCRRWQSVYQHSSIPAPPLSLMAPLNEQWMQQHAKKLRKVGPTADVAQQLLGVINTGCRSSHLHSLNEYCITVTSSYYSAASTANGRGVLNVGLWVFFGGVTFAALAQQMHTVILDTCHIVRPSMSHSDVLLPS